MDEDLSRTMGFVTLQATGLELLTRYSLNQNRATSVLSSLHEFRIQENEQTGGKQWNWKYLRNQFDQKDLEGLYRKYDNKLRETLIYIYISLLVTFSTVHIILVMLGTYFEENWIEQSQSTFLFMGMYILRITIPILSAWKCYHDKRKKKSFWMPMLFSLIITVDLVLTDIAVPIYSFHEGIPLRPAYATMALLSVYIFLPMRNNFISIILGVLVSMVYVLIFAFYTYSEDPQIGVVVTSDVIYMIGVNLMGIYFRLMNEIVTRRSFLDRRACVESTLRLIFVKDQEERLMLSILPEHIVSKVRQDIRAIYLRLQSHDLVHNVKSFNERYVEEHKNVSILSADVVNYTKISTTLSPLRMVELLNELFGRFDEASEASQEIQTLKLLSHLTEDESVSALDSLAHLRSSVKGFITRDSSSIRHEHDVLRIKFLGDCYYCVSGIGKPTPQHAKNCVDLGLEMIHIIKDVREKRALNMDMRIGVHSGRVLSGLVGIRKWQFDVWSKDVTIASKMESTGQAGKVHVTKQTLEQIVNFAREYIIEPHFASQSDEFVTENKLETFLISRPMRPLESRPYRRASIGLNKILTKTSSSKRADSRNSQVRRTTIFMDEDLVEYQQMLKAADAQMAKEIDEMTNGREQFKKELSLNSLTLMFKNFEMEKTFLKMPDPLFKYYITCCLIILILLISINCLTTNWLQGFHWYTWGLFTILIFILIVMQPLTWFHFFWSSYKGVEEPRNTFLRYIYDTSVNIIRSAKIRTGMYLIISMGLAATSIVNVSGCNEVKVDHESESVLSNCVSSWHVTQCWGLALLLNFLFSRVFFILKWIIAGTMTLFYLWVVWDIKTELFFFDTTWNVGLDPRLSHSLSVIFITVTLYWIDRTTEYRNKLDHVWQVQLIDEQQEAETMLKVNNMLLENILPAHVVQVYLNLHRSLDELYHESYKNVAVMFASLTDYKLGVEDDSDLSDKTVLSMLDSVISDFDRLLMTGSSAYKVEKIKMAGWTYMAACGLDPNRRDSLDTSSNHSMVEQNTTYYCALVTTMVEFATTMMMKLQDFNHSSFQSFEGLSLRIGISNGEVAAGVVGSTKPLYDIWGHAVNMASRMDSTGERGKIQVTENTALLLDESGILTTYRGETFVKGAGYIKTYFVPFDENFNLIKKERSQDYYRNEFRHYYDVRGSIDGDVSSMESFDTESQYSVRGTASRDLTRDIDCDISRTVTPTDIDVTDTITDTHSSDANSTISGRDGVIEIHL